MSQKLSRNNMKKRLFSFVLVLLMVVSVLPISAFANSSDVGVNMEEQYELAFTVDSVELGNDDETVEVNIRVSNNGGFAGMTYQLLFDKDVLSLEQQPELGDFSAFELTGGPLEEGKHTAMLSSVENVYGNGTVVTCTFKVNPQAECGSYDIRLVTDGYANLPDGSSVKLEVLDENFQVLDSYTVSGRITIPGYTVSYDANGAAVHRQSRQNPRTALFISARPFPQDPSTALKAGLPIRMRYPPNISPVTSIAPTPM